MKLFTARNVGFLKFSPKLVQSPFKFWDYFDLKSFPWLCTSGQGNENSLEMFPLQNLQFKPKNSCKYFDCAEKDKENENGDFISSSESHFLTVEAQEQRKRNLTLTEKLRKYKMYTKEKLRKYNMYTNNSNLKTQLLKQTL